jgi:hypothetical protein
LSCESRANSHHRASSHPKDKHGHAFLVGRISGLTPEDYDDLGKKEDDRWIIQFSEYAEIDIPSVWGGYLFSLLWGGVGSIFGYVLGGESVAAVLVMGFFVFGLMLGWHHWSLAYCRALGD